MRPTVQYVLRALRKGCKGMQYRTLAGTQLEVSTVAFGCWAIVGGFNWGEQEESDSIAALRAAFNAGVTFFDTAEGYGGGQSEQLIAKALGDVRDQIVIASKVSTSHLSRSDLREACERSLKHLSTDYMDLYQIHWPSRTIPLSESLEELEALKSEGKIRAYGVSNFGPQDLEACFETGHTVCSNQLAYNLLWRAIEFEILPKCLSRNVSVLCYSPLMQGLLTGKFSKADEVPEDRARTKHFSSRRPQSRHEKPGFESETFAAVEEVRKIAEGIGKPMADVTLAWLLAQQGVTSVIAGGRNAQQAQRNTNAAVLELSSDTLNALSAATQDLKEKLGANGDMWQDTRMR